MAEATYKILLFMKRRPDISVQAFRDYYENHHAPFCEKYSTSVDRYIRRYIEPKPHPETGPAAEFSFDVITELWFKDKTTFDGTLNYITTNIMPAEVVADERQLFDRASFRIATVVECESDLSKIR